MIIRLVNLSETHVIGVIETTKGNEYGCVFAKEFNQVCELTYPTNDDVKQAWKENKRDFRPYTSFN